MLLRLICLSLIATCAAQCPDPYVPLDESRCILLDAFVTRTYREAIDYCKTHGGDLLMMDDCETVGLVYDFIYSGAGMADKHYWLGASDEEEEGTWKFVDNRPVPMGTPFWGPNQPDNGETHNCAILHVIYNQRWFDIPCSNSYNVICLRKL